jgi:hypothetical protein
VLHAHYLMIAELPVLWIPALISALAESADRQPSRRIRMHRFFIGFKYLSSSLPRLLESWVKRSRECGKDSK